VSLDAKCILRIMARFAIYRLRDTLQERFRWSPKAASSTATGEDLSLKPTDYRDDGSIEAQSPYDAWERLRASGAELRVGDVVAEVGDEVDSEIANQATCEAVWICKFNGFERAQWITAESSDQPDSSGALASASEEQRQA
jgi:hypothetical protein